MEIPCPWPSTLLSRFYWRRTRPYQCLSNSSPLFLPTSPLTHATCMSSLLPLFLHCLHPIPITYLLPSLSTPKPYCLRQPNPFTIMGSCPLTHHLYHLMSSLHAMSQAFITLGTTHDLQPASHHCVKPSAIT